MATFGGFSLREETKTLSPGSLFHRRDKTDSGSTSVVTAAAQARMASREAEKEAAHMSSPVTSKNSQSTARDAKKHTTTNDESWLPSPTSRKEEVASKRNPPTEDSEIPKKKSKGSVIVQFV